MSDTMFYGVLQMPYEMAMSDEMSRFQFYRRVQEAVSRLQKAEQEISELRAAIATQHAEGVPDYVVLPEMPEPEENSATGVNLFTEDQLENYAIEYASSLKIGISDISAKLGMSRLRIAELERNSVLSIGKIIEEISSLKMLWGLGEPGALVRFSEVSNVLFAASKHAQGSITATECSDMACHGCISGEGPCITATPPAPDAGKDAPATVEAGKDGLPPLPKPLRSVIYMVSAVGSTHGNPAKPYYNEDQMREYGRLCMAHATPPTDAQSADETDKAEAAYWNFDARHKGYGKWKHMPQSERDAFKTEWRIAFAAGAEYQREVASVDTSKTAPAAPAPEDKFCNEHCTWLDHHPDCKHAAQAPAAWSYDMQPPAGFVEYVQSNYKGDVFFSNPEWHAKRLWNAAMRNAKHAIHFQQAAPAGDARDAAIPDMSNLYKVEMQGDFSVRLVFRSCSSANQFKHTIDAAMREKGGA